MKCSVLLAAAVAVVGLATTQVHANGRHDINGNVIEGLAEEELAVTRSGKLGDQTPSIAYWADKDPSVRASSSPPYPYPTDRKYNTKGGPIKGAINVHLVPHTHDDTGWQVTVDQYFASEVYYIVDTVVRNLAEDPNRKFIYVETGFFARWWEQADDAHREKARTQVKNKQLEFINGGWCMHDEASPLWTAMVDQTTRGHQFILREFGEEASPRGTWQIDPFGHTNTQAWLLGAEAGMESMFWGRMDYEDRNMRFNKLEGTNGFEWIWQGSKSVPDATIFAGDLYGTGSGGYSTWFDFDGNGNQVNDDPARHDYNVDQWVDKFVQDALSQHNHTIGDHQMWACGTDFQYQDAVHWFRNLDKLIHYVNLNGTVNAFYSTPSLYVDAKKAENLTYELRQDDIMPLADNAHNYWSGYFTSRPALKRQVRFATNFLQAARQLEVVTKTTADEVGLKTERPSPPVGTSWTDSLEGTVGVATHHDGMSGTERQDVSDDYEQRISESSFEVEAGVALSLSKLLDVDAESLEHCNCNMAGNCLNMSVCAASTGKNNFSVVAWNPLAHPVTEVLRIPVSGAGWSVVDGQGAAVESQVVALNDRTLSLPLLYLNSFNMTADEIAAAQRELANEADHELVFAANMLPVGYSTYIAKRNTSYVSPTSFALPAQASTVENSVYSLSFDLDTGLLSTIANKVTGVTTDLSITWGWYNSSVGGCTEYPADIPVDRQEPPCSGQKSGAYMFRPNSSEFYYPGKAATPTVNVVEGPVVTEVYQRFSDWATHVVRLYHDAARAGYVEVEWTAGPIPMDTPWFDPVAFDPSTKAALPNLWGKELVVRYASGLKSEGTWYTDSNGKEAIKRVYNERGPTYPHPYNISEPVAGNYYPVNAFMSLDDGSHELAVLTDVSMGGASLSDGALEYMVHRRIQDDDSRGVQEPLNETMCGCNDINADPGKMGENGHEGDGGCVCAGLTIRGRHWLVFDSVDKAHAARRVLSEQLNFPSTLTFSANPIARPAFTALAAAMPANVKLVTITNNYASFNNGQLLLRLSHLYEAGEHPTLAQPVSIDLTQVFAKAGLKITAATETSLTGNQPYANIKKHQWNTRFANDRVKAQFAQDDAICEATSCLSERAPFVFPTVTIRPMEVRTFLATFS